MKDSCIEFLKLGMLRIISQRAQIKQRNPALNPEDIARATELARKDKAGTMPGGKGNESPLGRVYHKNKQRRYNQPQPPAAHPAPDDIVRPIKPAK